VDRGIHAIERQADAASGAGASGRIMSAARLSYSGAHAFTAVTAVRSALVTALSTVAVNASAAVAALVMSHRFGRSVETDGFLAAYGVYLVLFLGAQSLRMAAAPELTRAAASRQLPRELWAYVTTLAVAGLPITLLVLAGSPALGRAVTGGLPAEAAVIAGHALAWLVPAAVAQVFAVLAASALAVLDDYTVAAAASGGGAIAGVLLFALLAPTHGVRSLAWGIALNGLISSVVPFARLVARGAVRAGPLTGNRTLRRLGRVLRAAALPLALQTLFVVALRLAADLGVGMVTLLSYAYMFCAMLIGVTASSISLIAMTPLTRRRLGADGAAAHVVHTSWLSLSVVAGAAAAAATAGGGLAVVLGDAFGGDVGDQLGIAIIGLAPWTVVTIVLSVTLPLLFVMDRTRFVVRLALLAVAVHVPLSLALRSAAGLTGIGLALALSTALVMLGVMARLSVRMLASSGRSLARAAMIEAGLAALAFAPIALLLGRGLPAAAVGLVLHAALHVLVRPRGLHAAWRYVRGLHEPAADSSSP
jgi:peptidoglycan biosynthesis protein MviN/MurJ (putative lipid II flippase)